MIAQAVGFEEEVDVLRGIRGEDAERFATAAQSGQDGCDARDNRDFRNAFPQQGSAALEEGGHA